MADQIVSWGGFNSKSTAGMGVTGSISVVGSGSFGYSNIASGNTYIKIDPNQFNSRITFNDFDGGISTRGGELEMSTYYSRLTYGSYNWFYIGIPNVPYLFYIGDNQQVLISQSPSKPTNATAMLQVKGTGTTSSTTSFLVQNANASSSLQIKDDLTSTFGGSMTIISNDYAGIDLRRTVPNSQSWLQLYATGDFNPVLFKTGTTDWLGYTRLSANLFLNRGSQTTLADNGGGQFTGSVVSNNLHIYDGTNSPKLVFWSPLSAQTPRGQISTSDGTSRGGNLIFSVNNNNLGLAALTEYMRITQVGNVGIGTSTPSSSLHISGASAVLTLSPQDPLPSGVPTGSFAVSSSAPPKPYFYDGTTWNALY
jgi:hypothetical protein